MLVYAKLSKAARSSAPVHASSTANSSNGPTNQEAIPKPRDTPGTGLGNSSSLPGQGTVRLRSPRWQAGQIAQHSLSVGADSPPSTGTGRRAFTQMEQHRRRYAAVSCRRLASTLLGSGRLAG